MHDLTKLSEVVARMPEGSLGAIVLLAGFGPAAFAIWAVITIAKERR